MSKLDEQIARFPVSRYGGTYQVTRADLVALIASTLQEIMPEKRSNDNDIPGGDLVIGGYNEAVSQMEQNAKEIGIEL